MTPTPLLSTLSLMKISAVVNTLNEEKNIVDCLESLSWVDEIIVVDMESDDRTRDLAYHYTKNVFKHPRVGFVEPARNFAINQTSGDWILILDADERIPQTLAKKLIDVAQSGDYNFVRIPRKNIIFNSWIQNSRWWPDHNVRFFKRGMVTWQNEIHSIPITQGEGLTLPDKEDLAIIHHHYQTITQFLTRMLRYTDIQSKELINQGYPLTWTDLVNKPFSEFLSRFFAGAGYKDGLHGLVLALLQAFSEFIVYLKVWEAGGFKKHTGKAWQKQILDLFKQKAKELRFWLFSLKLELATKKTQRLILRLRRKLNL